MTHAIIEPHLLMIDLQAGMNFCPTLSVASALHLDCFLLKLLRL